jgi:glutamate-ammonia-ligase adenylyltransferase
LLALAREIKFRDTGRAAGNLARLAAQVPRQSQDRLGVLLQSAADPDQASHYLVRFAEEQPEAFARLMLSPTGAQHLVTLFAHSQFLAEEVLKAPEWLDGVAEAGELHEHLTAETYAGLVSAHMPAGPPQAIELAAFRRRQLVRIVLRDVLGLGSLAEVTEEISSLADSILHFSLTRLREALVRRHGEPQCEDGSACGFSVIALGKHGGRELNYSSDIDLMFVFSGNGSTAGPEKIANRDFHKRLCVQLTELLSTYTPHGICYRVDLRLRPEGTLGEVCISLDAARTYYGARARDWELQMLIKARVAAGDPSPGRELLEFCEPLTYSTSLDFPKIEAVSEARVRISEKLARRRGGARQEFDIKLAPGGIRDIEFLVQCLQRLHGGRDPWLRHGGTQLALFRLNGKEHLSDIEYGRLLPAYQFLRDMEHRLQFAEDRQTHALPSTDEDMEALARRMPPAEIGGTPSAASLRHLLETHLENVRAVYDRVVHAQLPLHYTAQAVARASAPPPELAPTQAIEGISPNLARILGQQAPGLASVLARSRIRYGARAIEHFLEKMLPVPRWLGWLNGDPVLAGYVIDLFEHSPFFAGQLNRKPEWVEELHEMRLRPSAKTSYKDTPATLADPTDLRRFFNREMLRIQAESVCLRVPIFDTLQRTSELADCAISAAYHMALDESASAPPRGYDPEQQLMVVALGRLGTLELDLGSDADLIYVVPDKEAPRLVFWTKVAERTSELLTAYTGDGTLFAVDTRLRPNGGAGPLVQTVSAYRDYFGNRAQAWEGISYMKARGVAGPVEQATKFLEELQAVDFRRWGQGGRSRKELRQMRMRLESEQGRANPLKAGWGGYYDIDFALMYLRLKSAGIFYPVLNTPARISIIEKMGHLDRADSRFLVDAATFYRALDHSMRLSSGHAEGQIPASGLQLDMIDELMSRWTPDHLHDQPMPDEISYIQTRTREFFDRLFNA